MPDQNNMTPNQDITSVEEYRKTLLAETAKELRKTYSDKFNNLFRIETSKETNGEKETHEYKKAVEEKIVREFSVFYPREFAEISHKVANLHVKKAERSVFVATVIRKAALENIGKEAATSSITLNQTLYLHAVNAVVVDAEKDLSIAKGFQKILIRAFPLTDNQPTLQESKNIEDSLHNVQQCALRYAKASELMSSLRNQNLNYTHKGALAYTEYEHARQGYLESVNTIKHKNLSATQKTTLDTIVRRIETMEKTPKKSINDKNYAPLPKLGLNKN